MIVAIYARFSSVADLEKTSSIEAQIQMCKQKAMEVEVELGRSLKGPVRGNSLPPRVNIPLRRT